MVSNTGSILAVASADGSSMLVYGRFEDTRNEKSAYLGDPVKVVVPGKGWSVVHAPEEDIVQRRGQGREGTSY